MHKIDHGEDTPDNDEVAIAPSLVREKRSARLMPRRYQANQQQSTESHEVYQVFDTVRRNHVSDAPSPPFFNASHAARCVACHGVRSQPVAIDDGVAQARSATRILEECNRVGQGGSFLSMPCYFIAGSTTSIRNTTRKKKIATTATHATCLPNGMGLRGHARTNSLRTASRAAKIVTPGV